MDVNAIKKQQLLTKNSAVYEGETAHRHVLVFVFKRLTSLWNLICIQVKFRQNVAIFLSVPIPLQS